jgi:hypothetical protein
MAKNATALTVTINAKLDVDRKTAETCLRLVEAYVNANDVRIICHRKENGEEEYSFEQPSKNLFDAVSNIDWGAE